MSKYIDFYKPFFQHQKDADDFVVQCENLSASDSKHSAKVMMHQTQRLISIADDFPSIRPNRESLSLLFLLICVESISKLHDDFTSEGKSRHYVQRFFEKFIGQPDKDMIGNGFVDNSSIPMKPLGLKESINVLYDIRCDVVHEGKYWGFSFHDGKLPMVNTDPNVNAYLSLQELKAIISRGCINAIKDKLEP